MELSGLEDAAQRLSERDELMARFFVAYGVPALGRRGFDPGRSEIPPEVGLFGFIVEVVTYQQISAQAARRISARLEAVGAFDADAMASLADAELAATGLSGAKRRWLQALARDVATGCIDLDDLARMAPPEAHRALRSIPGIGPWSANMVAIFALGHLDVWPVEDLALRRALARRLPGAGDRRVAERLAEAWAPWRSVAALWWWQDDARAASLALEEALHDRKVDPARELAADLALNADEFEARARMQRP